MTDRTPTLGLPAAANGRLPRHFSLLRSFHPADFLTLANGACGMAAILLSIMYAKSGANAHLYIAAALVLLALFFDVADGRVARWRNESSVLGRELDSLADLISFGAAPAAIAYGAGLDTWLDAISLVFFVLCGLSRLARFNVTASALQDASGSVAYFEGTPIPTSIVPLGVLMVAVSCDTLWPVQIGASEFHLLSVLFVTSGCLMVSRSLRIKKL